MFTSKKNQPVIKRRTIDLRPQKLIIIEKQKGGDFVARVGKTLLGSGSMSDIIRKVALYRLAHRGERLKISIKD
jgi:hypothetical protein